jgi:tetratricopeptide (TPR) repeat protein
VAELTIDQALQQGVEAHKAGQVQEADRLYTAILKAQPKHPDANHNMGVLAVGVGKVEQALPFFKTALEANPKTAQFWLSYIDALIKLDKLADAKAVFDQAKSKGAKGDGFDKLEQRLKEAGEEPMDVAIQLRDTGEFNQAIDLLKDEINQSPQDVDILALLSHCYLLADQVDEAKLYLDKAKKISPDNALVGWNIARLTLKEKNPSEALNIARDTSRRFPDDVEGMGVLGACLRANAEINEGLEVLNRAIELNPDYAEALINRGLLRLSQENKTEALADLEVAHRLKPHIKQIWDLVISLKMEAQEYSDAILILINMIEIDPEDEKRLATLALCYQHLKDFDAAIKAYNKALAIKPDYAEAHINLGSALEEQGKLEEAIEAYNKALAIKPDYAEAYNNMGVTLKEQGKLEEAIEAYNKALAIKPDYADAYNNIGVTLKERGKLEEAIEAYNKALAIKPDYAEAYYNMGNALQEQDKLDEAVEAYNKALAIKPDYADAHRHLSLLTKYSSDTAQISEVEALLQQHDIGDSDRCNLLYTNAKMQEDLGDLSAAYASCVAGGGLRQKLLKYEFKQDEHLFDQIKRTAPKFKDVARSAASGTITHTPIFILGMPRSGTTLVEQIVSSHTEVTGAGELDYVSQFGTKLVAGLTTPTLEAVSEFRERYLTELAKRAEGQAFATDKMPQNFRYIALICAAFPEAKIVHVQRNAEATCWSNFKHYFASKGLGYSYNLSDTVKYYGLYKELMHFWSQSYSDRIYNLDYDKLTEDQEPETRYLIECLGLKWEDACLAPQNNKRAVRTASQQQVRQKVYKGSSQAWRKYEPFLDGVFDELET